MDTSSRRTPKACENCRSRRIKCSGRQPCEGCEAAGIAETCEVRVKARPNRVPKVALEALSTSTPSGWKSAHFVQSVERDVERWAERQGQILPTNLSDVFPIRASFMPRQSLAHPLQPAFDLASLKGFLAFVPYFDFVDADSLTALLNRYNQSPDSLSASDRAILFAALCVGCLDKEQTSEGDDVFWYRRSLTELDAGEVSSNALKALHLLHLFAVQAGGILEVRDILRRMATQVRQLQVLRVDQRGESFEKMLFATVYKDSWYAAICDSPPFLDAKDFQPRLVHTKVTQTKINQGPVSLPILVQLTEMENEITLKLHSSTPALTSDYLLQVEKRWAVWMKAFREEQIEFGRSMLYTYANIRFHWIRLMLHYSLLEVPTRVASALAMMARSVAHVLRAYFKASTDTRYVTTWPDLRRITTCGHLVVILYDAGELLPDEVQDLLGLVIQLLRGLAAKCPMALDTEGVFLRLLELMDLSLRLPPSQPDADPTEDPFIFDYSLPPLFDDWFLTSSMTLS